MVFHALLTAAADENIAPDLGDRGPLFSGTIKSQFPGQNDTMKGIVVTLGAEKQAHVCYDTDLLRVSIGWTGGFLNFGNSQTRIEHPQPPAVIGTPVFGTQPGPGWARGTDFSDPRPNHQGPLPRDWAKYRGLYRNGNNVILSYTVGDCSVLEMPGLETQGGHTAFTRTFQMGRSTGPLTLLVAEMASSDGEAASSGQGAGESKTGDADKTIAALISATATNHSLLAAGLVGAPKGAAWKTANGRMYLQLPPHLEPARFRLAIWRGSKEDLSQFFPFLNPDARPENLADLTAGGPARWAAPVMTRGVRGADEGPYVVDALTEPVPNPWGAKTFFGGFDFFSDGRAAICTFHGDVWIVSGLEETLEKLSWKRFASGLFQPLGLKIVENTVYVLGRDQITRLHDLNHDGEADFYENFNSDAVVTANYHEFCLDLQTDSAGNFYFAKGAPWPPLVDSPHQGCLLEVSKDGSRLEIVATGFRAPNGMTIGPQDQILVSDNQGQWMPSSKVNLVKRGGFYGMLPAAHRALLPADFDQPLCWVPYGVDNSSGGLTYVTSDRWGPFRDLPLFESYGRCTLFYLMTEEVAGQAQAGLAQFPLKFDSGLMRARFNPRDGQLYVCGLKGWQTSATKDGGFYRVRYTGKPVYLAKELHVARTGIQIKFTSPLDAMSAADLANWNVEQWNYIWAASYGSPEISAEDPQKKNHDSVAVQSIQVSEDKTAVFLEMPGIRPVMQMKIKFNIHAADGTAITQEIYNSILRVPKA